MKQTKILMGMPITIEILDTDANEEIFNKVFSYFKYIDNKFSTYKDTSEISLLNKGEITEKEFSEDMQEIFKLSEKTKEETNGYFDIKTPSGRYDTSGLVKGWAIYNASKIIKDLGFENFYVEAGGDIQTFGNNSEGKDWKIGIRNPFKHEEIIKTLSIKNKGMATSGTYIRGQHIYNPKNPDFKIEDIVSLTVIGDNIYEADRFATAAFAMGKEGIFFINKLSGFEGYMVDNNGIATMTDGFEKYIA